MIIQTVKFKTALSKEEVWAKAKERLPQFQAIPGLLQKYYIKLDQPNHYGGVYIWDSKESLSAYRNSDLAKSIPKAYQVVGTPSIEITEVLFPLRAKTNG